MPIPDTPGSGLMHGRPTVVELAWLPMFVPRIVRWPQGYPLTQNAFGLSARASCSIEILSPNACNACSA